MGDLRELLRLGVVRRLTPALLAALVLLPGCGRRRQAPVDVGAAYGGLLAALSRDFEVSFAGGPPDADAQDMAEWAGWWDSFVVDPDPEPVWPAHKREDAASRWAVLKQQLPSLTRDTCDDFFARNERPTLPAFTSAGDIRIVVADREELKRIFVGTYVELDWERFHSRYGRSTLVALSAMGFSRDGRQGLVYAAFPGWYGGYYVMTNDGRTWRIADEWNTWVS